MKVFAALAVSLFLIATATSANENKGQWPCKEKAEAKHMARKAVNDCLDAWAKNEKPTDPMPAEDCSSKTQAFVQAVKDLRTCHQQQDQKPNK